MTQYEGRAIDLKNRVNKHLQKITGEDIDYFSKLDQSDLIELKTVLSDINNLLTFKMAIEAMNWISNFFQLDSLTRKKNINKIDKTKPNSKGFDIHLTEPYNIIAEVKCISPINNGGKFGVAQHDGIMKDVGKLIEGKGNLLDTTKFYKFMFLIDLGDRTDQAILQLLPATKGKTEIANRYNELKNYHMILLQNDVEFCSLDTKKVYLKKILVN